MPGAGKSTVGVLLAKRLLKNFIDTDLLIQASSGRSLQSIVDTDGYMALRQLEEQALVSISEQNAVIATGGSAVYSDRAMRRLQQDGLVVWLQVSLPRLEQRISDMATRGLARPQNQTFAELYDERCKLYAQYADISLACDGLVPDQVCDILLPQL